MKKPQRLKKLKLTVPKIRPGRSKPAEERVSEALSNVPRITNETVSEQREEVLSSARKYIYPLTHPKHSIVRTSAGLLVLLLIAFFAYCFLGLYRLQLNSGFMYGVTSVVPFPVAKAGHNWVSYESYLFELRRNMHYYHTQQQTDFSSKDGQAQLARLKSQALTQAVQDAYVKQLAATNHVTVSNQTVDNWVDLVRNQNRLGSNERVFRDVLSQFWGWSEADFRRELRQQLLQQAVVAKLDGDTYAKAQSVLSQLKAGADFGKTATDKSEDLATKASGGQYGVAVTPATRDISPIVTSELFRLKPGQTSGIVNTGYTLEIVKVIDRKGDSLHAAHIQFNLKPIHTFVAPLQAKQPAHAYITVKPV